MPTCVPIGGNRPGERVPKKYEEPTQPVSQSVLETDVNNSL